MRQINLVALLNFMNFSDPDLDTFCDKVYKALLDNAYYHDVQPMLSDFKVAFSSYAVLLSVAKGGSRVQQEEKNVAKKAVLAILRSLCKEVNYAADNNRVKLLSSGFDIYGSAKKQQIMSALKAA